MWTIEQGIEIAREIEERLKPVGYHCGLGGGLLHKGTSDKDCDIFVYPHKRKITRNTSDLFSVLVPLLINSQKVDFNNYDEKEVYYTTSRYGRVDLFFL